MTPASHNEGPGLQPLAPERPCTFLIHSLSDSNALPQGTASCLQRFWQVVRNPKLLRRVPVYGATLLKDGTGRRSGGVSPPEGHPLSQLPRH